MKASKTDPSLGVKIQQALQRTGIETPRRYDPDFEAEKTIARHMASIMNALGLDVTDDSLVETPMRIGKMFVDEIFYGLNYANFPKCTTIENKMGMDELIAERCVVKSMCEHHFLPIVGQAWVGYLPRQKVLGLSKLNRVVDFFSRRPQVQERLVLQISTALQTILDTEDVAVVIKASHMCVQLRGVEDENAWTTTSCLSGKFRSVDALRAEFMTVTRRE